MQQAIRSAAIFTLAFGVFFGIGPSSHSQSRRQIKVVIELQQTESQKQEALQGAGSVIIRRGTAHPSGRLIGSDRQTMVQRKTGIFTLVQDGGETLLSVATRVPYDQITYFRNYATEGGYIERQIVFTDVGTAVRVGATILPDNQIRVHLTPRLSYFSAERSGAIDFTELATEVIVPNGQPLSLGGSTSRIHELTRQILGYQNRSVTGETGLTLTATIQ
jgi:Bacterial type II and III secretion system protein